MRFANNNKAIINKLTRKSVKANKLRNLFAIIAITLTTVLFTSLFTIGMGMIKSVEQQTMRQGGGSAHGTFKYLTEEEFKTIKDHSLIRDYGYSIIVSMAENKAFLKHQTEIRYATDTQARMYFSQPTTGHMPQKENEMATDTKVLDLLGVPHKIGEKITIDYTINGKKQTKDFVLTGYWKSDEIALASMIFVSGDFIDKNLTGVPIDKGDISGIGAGLISLDVMFSNSFNIQENIETVLRDKGYSTDENSPNYIATGVNWAYMSNSFTVDIPTIIGILGAGLLIIFTGYLIIYNIFQISVIKDIRFYGLLKTIGTTPTQIRRLVRKQALLLSIIGIPIGLAMGYLIGNVLLPIIMSTTSITTTSISFSPIIFICATLFTILTVFISCRKPGKIASKVSPIEAIRYVDTTSSLKKKEKHSLNGGKVYKMAFSNIGRNKKKAVVVIISMSLSLILLNSVFTFTNGFDMDRYLNKFVVTDFIVGHANYFNNNGFHSQKDVPSEQMINRIAHLDGIEDSGRIYYNLKPIHTTINGQNNSLQLYGLEDFPLSQLNIVEGEFNLEKFKTGNYIIEGISSDDYGNIRYQTSKYTIGDRVPLTFGNNVTKEYEVMAKAEIVHNMSVRYYSLGSSTIYLPAEEFTRQIEDPSTMSYLLDVKDHAINRIESYLENYTINIDQQMNYESKRKYVDQFKDFQNMFLLVGGILSFIIGIIGVLNFVNAMLTSIISRRREFAMLQSIGMTKEQLNKMLIFEGLFYAIVTIVISLLLGSLLSLIVVEPIASNVWFYKYKFVLYPILITSPILICVSIIVPFMAYIGTSKETIVERLREAE